MSSQGVHMAEYALCLDNPDVRISRVPHSVSEDPFVHGGRLRFTHSLSINTKVGTTRPSRVSDWSHSV